MEFSGRDSNGKRVIGVVAGGALATSVLVHKDLLWQVPDEWTLEEAATVPRCYSLVSKRSLATLNHCRFALQLIRPVIYRKQAYYALVVRGNIQPGESIYVHAGASGISTASLAIAIELGVTPYVGVFNREQKELLKLKYPQVRTRERCLAVKMAIRKNGGA